MSANGITDDQIAQQVADMQSRLDKCAQRGRAYHLKWHEAKSIIAIIQTLQRRLADANDFSNDIVEREAAICPEDVGFDEYIRVLSDALRPFAAASREDGDPDEAVLVRGEHMVLNRDLARAARLLGRP
jgi:hypothetical protein